MDAVDGDGAGVDHALDTCPSGDLEHVVGALDVDVEAVAGTVLAGGGQQGGEMDDAGDLMGVDRLHQVGHVGDISTVEGHGVHAGIEGGARGREVEGDDLLPALEELADDAGPDEAGAAGDHDCHKGVRSCCWGG